MLYNPQWEKRRSGLIFPHYSQVRWDARRWPDFSPRELACRHCGECYHWPEFIDRLQLVRSNLGKPIKINSGHRCLRYNLKIGGAPLSEHRKLATDLSLRRQDRHLLYKLCKLAGFTGFGYYQTFLHVDMGRRRFWYGGPVSKEIWNA